MNESKKDNILLLRVQSLDVLRQRDVDDFDLVELAGGVGLDAEELRAVEPVLNLA